MTTTKQFVQKQKSKIIELFNLLNMVGKFKLLAVEYCDLTWYKSP